jgi:hypothetical protein
MIKILTPAQVNQRCAINWSWLFQAGKLVAGVSIYPFSILGFLIFYLSNDASKKTTAIEH